MNKVQQIIAKARDEKSTFLDLGNLGITEIPDELVELSDLERLNLGNKYYTDGSWNQSKNDGEKNIIKYIPYKFRRLSNLVELSLHGCFCVEVSYLGELPQLTSLDLSFGYQFWLFVYS